MKTKMMKAVYLSIFVMFFAVSIFAQVSINTDGSMPDSSAMLDVKSTSQGVLIPRLTVAQIEAITDPADGLMVYCTTDKKIYIFNGETMQWKGMSFGASIIGPGGSGSCGQPITDPRDGKTYSTVQIGTQCWMAQYLNIGTRISGSVDQTNNSIIEKYCYNDNDANCAIYGGIYQWDEMMNYATSSSSSPSGRQGICPAGWHVPSDNELNLLRNFAGGEDAAGGNLKEVGTGHWADPNLGATNLHGFTSLPCGFSFPGGTFSSLSNYTNVPSATETSETSLSNVWKYGMHFDNTTFARGSVEKSTGTTVRCVKDPNSGIPTVTTYPVTNITQTTATGGGDVTSQGGAPVTARGVCWSTSSNPTIADSHTTDGSGTGLFESNLTGLSPETPYYIKAYATSSFGTAYGNELSFTTLGTFICGTPLVDPRDGKTYTTVQIGTQCWMSQNLNVGIRIDDSVDQTNNSILEKYCCGNVESNCDVHGGLYQWAEMVQYINGATNSSSWNPVPTGNVEGICPTGWHLPTNEEWNTLTTFLGGISVAGGKLKETGTVHWADPNYATNSSGFTALPGGNGNNPCQYMTEHALYHSASPTGSTMSWIRILHHGDEAVQRLTWYKEGGGTVRCLKN